MTDKDLLELAAKAMGFKKFRMLTDMPEVSYNSNYAEPSADWFGWNPLTIDSCAFRVMTTLKLSVEVNNASVVVSTYQSDTGETREVTEYYDHPEEVNQCTRLAIVRAAVVLAELGYVYGIGYKYGEIE